MFDGRLFCGFALFERFIALLVKAFSATLFTISHTIAFHISKLDANLAKGSNFELSFINI